MIELSVDLLSELFRHAPLGAAYCDRSATILWSNPRWRAVIADLGEAARVELSPPTSLYGLLAGSEPLLQPVLSRVLAGETVEAKAMRLVAGSEVLYWDVSMTPALLPPGEPGALLLIHDVTDVVISQRLLERRIQDHTRRLSALIDVSAVVTESGDPRAIIRASLRHSLEAVQASAGAVQLLDKTHRWLNLAEAIGLPAEVIGALQRRQADAGLAGWICVNKRPLTADLRRDERVSAALRESDLVAFAGVPMIVEEEMVGVLSAYREKQRPFKTTDLDLLNAVADQIGIVIDFARLRHAHEQLLVTEERNRLARELHDAVTQSLHSLTLFAGAIRRFLEAGDVAASLEYVEQLGDTAQLALKEMRLLLHNLRPAVLEQVGLAQALQQRLDAVEKRAGIQTELDLTGPLSFPAHVEEAVYHITGEALNNALKHASARRVRVALVQAGEVVRLTIADDGRGFVLESADRAGIGLASMRERVERLNGAMSITSAPNAGATITVQLDLRRIPSPRPNVDVLQWDYEPEDPRAPGG